MLETPQTDSTSVDTNHTTETTQAPSQQSDFKSSWMDALDRALDADSNTTEATQPSQAKPETDEINADKTTEAEASEKENSDEADEDKVKNMTQSAGAKFKEIKAEAKAAKVRIAELEAKLSTVESSPKVDHEEVAKLKTSIEEREQKIATYEKELAISRFEATEEYRDSVVKPMAAILNVVARMAEKYSVPERALLGALEESDPDKQGDMIVDLASNFTERDRVSLYQLGDDFAQLLDHRDKMKANAKSALDQREVANKDLESRRHSESKASWDKAASSVWDRLKAKIQIPVESGVDKAKFESELISGVKDIAFDSLSDEHKAFAAFSGSIVPHILKQNSTLQSEIAELKSSLKRYQSATPGAGSGAETKPNVVNENMGFLEALEAKFAAG